MSYLLNGTLVSVTPKAYVLNQKSVLLKIPLTAEFLAYIHLCLQNGSLGPT